MSTADALIRLLKDPERTVQRRGGKARMSLGTDDPCVARLMARLLQEKGAATRALNTARRCRQLVVIRRLEARRRRAARAIARVQALVAQQHEGKEVRTDGSKRETARPCPAGGDADGAPLSRADA